MPTSEWRTQPLKSTEGQRLRSFSGELFLFLFFHWRIHNTKEANSSTAVDGMADKGSASQDERAEMTIDTPLPLPVDPPPQIVIPNAPLQVADEPQLEIPVATFVGDGIVESANNGLSPNPTMCRVVAPATLAGGFSFEATVDGIDFMVVVPEGGVIQGQAFQVPYPVPAVPPMAVALTPLEIWTPTSNVPTGRWRNSLWSCCQVVRTGMFWQGFFCPLLLLGQVLTRNKLNVFGMPSAAYRVTFERIVMIGVGYCLGSIALAAFVTIFPPVSAPETSLVAFGFLVIVSAIAANTRIEMRRRYQIPVECCHGCNGRCDDLCCGIWCSCCIIIQMARHTHSEVDYPYVCCTSTGLTKEDAAGTV
jgi:Cys-rich protein (TIGR01571 family)